MQYAGLVHIVEGHTTEMVTYYYIYDKGTTSYENGIGDTL